MEKLPHLSNQFDYLLLGLLYFCCSFLEKRWLKLNTALQVKSMPLSYMMALYAEYYSLFFKYLKTVFCCFFFNCDATRPFTGVTMSSHSKMKLLGPSVSRKHMEGRTRKRLWQRWVLVPALDLSGTCFCHRGFQVQPCTCLLETEEPRAASPGPSGSMKAWR